MRRSIPAVDRRGSVAKGRRPRLDVVAGRHQRARVVSESRRVARKYVNWRRLHVAHACAKTRPGCADPPESDRVMELRPDRPDDDEALMDTRRCVFLRHDAIANPIPTPASDVRNPCEHGGGWDRRRAGDVQPGRARRVIRAGDASGPGLPRRARHPGSAHRNPAGADRRCAISTCPVDDGDARPTRRRCGDRSQRRLLQPGQRVPERTAHHRRRDRERARADALRAGLHGGRPAPRAKVALAGTWLVADQAVTTPFVEHAFLGVNRPAEKANETIVYTPAYGDLTPTGDRVDAIITMDAPAASAVNRPLTGSRALGAPRRRDRVVPGRPGDLGVGDAGNTILTDLRPGNRRVTITFKIRDCPTDTIAAIGGGPSLVQGGVALANVTEGFKLGQIEPPDLAHRCRPDG